MYNDFARKKKSNDFDVITLTNEIDEHNNKILESEQLEEVLRKRLSDTKLDIEKNNDENDRLLNSKQKIDVSISALNPSALQGEVDLLTQKGKEIKTKISEMNETISSYGEIVFDEDLHHLYTKEFNNLTSQKAVHSAEINRLTKVIEDLIAGGICQSCNRKLDDVDNTEHIAKHNEEILNNKEKVSHIEERLSEVSDYLTELNEVKVKVDKKNRLELDRDRLEVEIGSLRNKVVEKMNDLKKYNLNLEAIEHNKRIDGEVSKIKTNISVLNHTKDEAITRIERVTNDIQNHKNNIVTKTKLIETIKKEEEIDRIFKIYIDLVGKKGISKLVLRSVLPIINSEVQRLLEDVCDFEVEIFIDDKNDVQFLINKDEVSKQLKSASGFEKTASSLALRGVLGKMSTLPMPNFITFDEVLGKVAPENIEKLKALFDKIKDMYEIVFLITHNDLVKDWSSNVVTVNKVNNISNISMK
jgi:DNA repair exonuclease SbcCD ATPase subunit